MIYFIGDKKLIPSEIYKDSSIKECLEYFKDKDEIQVDTETEGFDPWTNRLICLQLGDSDNQFVIENKNNLKVFKELLESKTLIIHNSKFDLKFLYHQGIYPRKIFDTFLAESIITQGLNTRRSLQAVANKYLKINLDKSIRGIIHTEGLSDRVITYAALDCTYLQQIKEFQLKEVISQNRLIDLKIQNNFARVLSYIEYCGIRLDSEKWKEKVTEDLKSLQSKEKALNDELIRIKHPEYSNVQGDLFGSTPKVMINWMSPKQIIPIFRFLKLDISTVNKKGIKVESIEETNLMKYKGNSFVDLYLEYRKAEKVCSTYGSNFFDQINPVTHRLHTNYKQLVDSGRTSSGGKDRSNKVEWINHQNIPRDKKTRSCFIPEKKNKFVICDYVSQEICVFVNISKVKKMLDFFLQGNTDFHSFICQRTYPELRDKSFEEIAENHSEQRYKAKQGNFSVLYGANPYTISTQLNISLEEAEKFYNTYFQEFPQVKDYFNKCYEETMNNGYITIDEYSGAKFFLSNLDTFNELGAKFTKEFWDEYKIEKKGDTIKYKTKLKPLVSKFYKLKGEISRKSTNYRIQGKSALISKVGGILFFDWILDNNLFGTVKIPVFCHDEYLIETNEDNIDLAKTKIEECMEKAGTYWCKTIPLKAKGKISNSWGEK